METIDFLYKVFLFYLPLLFSLCVHEYAHGWTALKFGDRTALRQGRVTLNPLAHIDYIGTLLLPLGALFMNWPVFGWAKPVPVDASYLKDPKREMFWVALAGPLSNFLLAFIGTFVLTAIFLLKVQSQNVFSMMEMFIYINLLLGAFNLLPLHPLDGGKVLERFLPFSWNRFLEENQHYGTLLLICLFVSGGFSYLAWPIIWTAQQMIDFSQTLSHWIL